MGLVRISTRGVRRRGYEFPLKSLRKRHVEFFRDSIGMCGGHLGHPCCGRRVISHGCGSAACGYAANGGGPEHFTGGGRGRPSHRTHRVQPGHSQRDSHWNEPRAGRGRGTIATPRRCVAVGSGGCRALPASQSPLRRRSGGSRVLRKVRLSPGFRVGFAR